MNESQIVQQTIDNICRLNATSFLSVYKSKLIELATNKYGDEGVDIIQIHVLPKLEALVNSSTIDGLIVKLKDANSANWIKGRINAPLSSDVDQELSEMSDFLNELCRKTKEEIEHLQKKQSRADLIADIFTVVKRDISGHALELQHTNHGQRTNHGQHREEPLPYRKYCYFKYTVATHLEVLQALKYKLNERNDFPNESNQRYLDPGWYENLRCTIGDSDATDGTVNRWLQDLANNYTRVANRYPSLKPKHLIDYMIEKEERNKNSHFRDNLKETIENERQISFDEFIRRKAHLSNVFTPTERDLLTATFDRYCEYLDFGLKLHANNKITITPNNNPRWSYWAHFIRETDSPHFYRIAEVASCITDDGRRIQIPRYWQPHEIDINQHTIRCGHHSRN